MQQPILLSNRGVLRLTGEDRKNFLQGLITNDIHLLTPFHSLYTALLNPQGKFLHDFFLVEERETILPEAGKDMIPERSIPLETGLQDLNAVSWTKGCYLGQELTARTRYRGEIRKRLLPVEIASDSFDATQPILDLKGGKAGELYSFQGTRGIARLRLEKLKGHLFINSVPLTAHIPSWIHL